MNESGSDNMQATLRDISAQLSKLAQRVSGLEELASMGGGESVPTRIARELPSRTPEPLETPSSVATEARISEEEVLAITAALAAWLGVHAHIRQIRLIRTGSWSQQGRVTIQASHRLYH